MLYTMQKVNVFPEKSEYVKKYNNSCYNYTMNIIK